MKKYILIWVIAIFCITGFAQPDFKGIKPIDNNPSFWQFNDEPVLLIGGSTNDNLFQNHDVFNELDLLVYVGGNYVRNTLCSNNDGNKKPFWRYGERYNLDKYNNEYWGALDKFLQMTADRNIIVQLEIWNYNELINDWDKSPWNSKNNNVFSIPSDLDYGKNKNGKTFFSSIPAENNDSVLLKYQMLFVDKLLSVSMPYNHVIYSVSDTQHEQSLKEWNLFWTNYILEKTLGHNIEICTSGLSPKADEENNLVNKYTCLDFLQNSLEINESHWDNLCSLKRLVSDSPKPINNSSVVGGQFGAWTSGPGHGVERFWRNLIAGSASVRFEAEPFGLGLSKRAQMHLKSARLLSSEYNFFTSVPDEKSSLILERENDEAYLARNADRDVIVYFTDGGQIVLDFTDFEGTYLLKWLNLEGANWHQESMIEGGGILELTSPSAGNWVALLIKTDDPQ